MTEGVSLSDGLGRLQVVASGGREAKAPARMTDSETTAARVQWLPAGRAAAAGPWAAAAAVPLASSSSLVPVICQLARAALAAARRHRDGDSAMPVMVAAMTATARLL